MIGAVSFSAVIEHNERVLTTGRCTITGSYRLRWVASTSEVTIYRRKLQDAYRYASVKARSCVEFESAKRTDEKSRSCRTCELDDDRDGGICSTKMGEGGKTRLRAITHLINRRTRSRR